MQERMRGDAFLENAMEKHGDAVYRLALCRLGSRADAEDVYQDVFLRLLRDSTEFRTVIAAPTLDGRKVALS